MAQAPLVTLNLGRTPSLVLKDIAAVSRFVHDEREHWAKWWALVKTANVPIFSPGFVQQVAIVWDSWAARIDAVREKGIVERRGAAAAVAAEIQAQLNNEMLLLSMLTSGALVLALARKNPAASFLVAACLVTDIAARMHQQGSNPLVSFWKTFVEGLPDVVSAIDHQENLEAARIARIDIERLRDEASMLRDECEQLRQQLEMSKSGLLSRVASSFANALRLERSKAGKQHSEVTKEWRALKRTYDLKLKTTAPYNYWKAKRILHQRSAKRWGQAFAQILIFGPISLAIVSALFVGSDAKFQPPYILPIAFLAVPAFAALWAARLSNRKYNEEQLRAEDANERATMVKTLLALTRKDQSESSVADTEMAIMLTSLFRPGPGLNAEDSPAVSILETALKAIRGEGGK